MQWAGKTGDDAPRAVLFFLVVRPKMPSIMAGLDQMDSCLEKYRNTGLYWEISSYVSVCSAMLGLHCCMLCVSLRTFI